MFRIVKGHQTESGSTILRQLKEGEQEN
jgi:hypothetical protein